MSGTNEHHHDRRFELLHNGFIDIVSFLKKLPPSEHDETSFKLDSCYFTVGLFSFQRHLHIFKQNLLATDKHFLKKRVLENNNFYDQTFKPEMISFSLTGVFREGKTTDKVRPLRNFQRTFVCVPDPETKYVLTIAAVLKVFFFFKCILNINHLRMKIINEQFILSNITHDQYTVKKRLNKFVSIFVCFVF
jgi:hypothetical protein